MRREIIPRTQWSGLYRADWETKKPFADAMGYSPHLAQLEVHSDPHRFKVVCCGRRFGKSKLCAFEAVFCALMGGWVMTCAPTYNLANKVWLESVMMVEGSEFRSLIADQVTQEGKQVIRFKSGGLIACKSSENPRGLVGDGWDLCIFDEAAREPSKEPWMRDIRPALADRQGGALFPSTPLGDNWFKDIYDFGQSDQPKYKNWKEFHFPSSANPLMTPEEIEELTFGMTRDLIKQEIYAEFLGSGGSVFRTYHQICDAEWQENPLPGHTYCAGLDIGKVHDYTVFAVWDCTWNCLCHIERVNLVPYPELERIATQCLLKWGCPVLVDITRESGTADRLRETCWFTTVTGFHFSNESKAKIMNQLAISFDEGLAHLLTQDTELGRECYKEFGAYRYERMASGTVRMSAPQGRYDDIVCAVAMAYECCIRYTGIGGTVISKAMSAPPRELSGTYSFAETGTPRNAAIGTSVSPIFRL